MGARIDYMAGGEAGYTGASLPTVQAGGLDFIGGLRDRVGQGINRLIDVEFDRVISTRTPTPRVVAPVAPAPMRLPEWAPFAAVAVGVLLLLPLLKKG